MKLTINSDPSVIETIERYQDPIKKKLLELRAIIFETAENHGIQELEETLKWGEPSYLTKSGSTIRIDWKEKNPTEYAMYFKCTSKLVPTFKLVFNDIFKYEKDRAILFQLDERIPRSELKQCIAAALTYHKVKQLPLLGIK